MTEWNEFFFGYIFVDIFLRATHENEFLSNICRQNAHNKTELKSQSEINISPIRSAEAVNFEWKWKIIYGYTRALQHTYGARMKRDLPRVWGEDARFFLSEVFAIDLDLDNNTKPWAFIYFH